MIGEGRGMSLAESPYNISNRQFQWNSWNYMKEVWKKYTAHKNKASMYLSSMDVEKDMIKAMHMIKAALCEPHNEVQQMSEKLNWCSPVWGTESTSNTQEKYEKMTPQKVILPSDVFAWLSNIIANGSVRQTQKHFTNFMCSSFVFWLAEETKCSSASQASCFWRLHVTQLGTSRTVHIRTCVASSFHISPSSKYLR